MYKNVLHIVFNKKKGPFLKLNVKESQHDICPPFLLLHKSRSVHAQKDRKISYPISMDRNQSTKKKLVLFLKLKQSSLY